MTLTIDGPRRRLAQVLDAIPPSLFDRLTYLPAEGGYERAVLPLVDGVEPVAIRWPAGSSAKLHGHGASAVLLRVLTGSLVEYRFVPGRTGFRFRRVLLEAGMDAYLPPGSFHAVVALAPTTGLHTYSTTLAEPTEEVPASVLPRLREAFERDLDPADSPVPPELLAALGERR
jgi:hypothetical protein